MKSLKLNRNKKIKIHNNFDNFDKLFKNKVDYTMSSITGIDGLEPTIKIIKHTKKIAIANKESLICGWNLIKKELNKFKTNFIPIDSEHFSIYSLIQNSSNDMIDKVFITASGGPFLKFSNKRLKKIKKKKHLIIQTGKWVKKSQ